MAPSFSRPSSPSSCLRALLSPPNGPSYLRTQTPSSTSNPNELNSQPSSIASSSSTLPQFNPLPPSPPISPNNLRLSGLFISQANVGDSEEDLVLDGLTSGGDDGGLGDVEFLLGGRWKPVCLAGLAVEDRNQMDQLMNLKCTRADAEMGAEVVGLLVPSLPRGVGHDSRTRSQAATKQKDLVAKYLLAWTPLSPHPLVVLIATIIYLERLLSNYPSMGTEVISQDAPLRITFASFLLALKWLCDVGHLSKSFLPWTPWTLQEINTMEKQLLGCLKWDVFISSKELLHRAAGFWNDAQTLETRSHGVDSGDVAIPGNLFLLQKRAGVEEKSWRGGIVRGSGVAGSRLHSGGVDEVGFETEGGGGEKEKGRDGEGDEDSEFSTVWKGGRLERRGTWEHISKKETRSRRERSSRSAC